MKQSITCAMAITIALMASGNALAQKPDPAVKSSGTSGTATNTADTSFVKEAATGGMAEVELGRLATQKAQSSDVKQFGQRMVDDHSKANDQLKPIAQQKNVTIPTELSGKEKALYDRLSKLSGEAFDRAYMRAMVEDHRKDVAAFRKESTSGKDPAVKQFASQTLPTLEDHLKMAESTAGAASTSGQSKQGTKGTSGTTTGTHTTTPGTDTSGTKPGTTTPSR